MKSGLTKGCSMKKPHKRIAVNAGGLAALTLATALVLNAFQNNLVFFFTPTQVSAGEAPQERTFRVGGIVQADSVQRDGLTVQFIVRSEEHTSELQSLMRISYAVFCLKKKRKLTYKFA